MAKSNLYVYTYNNYFNRIVKKENSLVDYGTPETSLTDVNFDYADGVTTSHVCNYGGAGDYLIVTDSENNILHRWFIIENQKTRGGQYKLILRRDLLVDYEDIVVNAPMIVERAMITNTTSPLLYASEGFSFNQIKKNEILLKDNFQMPWYVLYFKKGAGTITGSYTRGDVVYNKEISSAIASSIYAPGTYKYAENLNVTIKYRPNTNDWGWAYFTDLYDMTISENGINHTYNSASSLTSVIWFNNSFDECKSQLNNKFSANGVYASLKADVLADNADSGVISDSTYQELSNIDPTGIIIKDSDNKLYHVTVTKGVLPKSGNLANGDTKSYVESIINSTTLDRSDHFGDNTVNFSYTLFTLTVNVEEITDGTVNWTLWDTSVSTALKQHTLDSDFDIIAVPYNDIRFWTTVPYQTSGLDAKLFVDSVAQAAGSNLVDIQLIPYCPLQELWAIDTLGNGYIDIRKVPDGNTQRIEANPGQPTSYTSTLVLYLSSCNYTFNINQSLSVPSMSGKSDVVSAKVDNECSLYKIVSPNYNGSFEFSVAKNQGVDFFNVDITLIPYNPYIHINPNFKGLYGSDWNDSKGLICGGDFSLPRYTDQFAEYELNNKNYQMIFDRQIRNLDFKQHQERVNTYWQLAAGTVQGAGTGAVGGSLLGGPAGMAVGAAVGGGLALAGGIMDAKLMNERQAEEKSFALDNWSYQLGNIKALPDTINKVTPLTFNHKIYPFIEIYSATDEEKSLFANYLDWRSMKVDSIGVINNFIQSEKHFIQGKILRLEDLGLASLEAFEIYNEIKKGVYI